MIIKTTQPKDPKTGKRSKLFAVYYDDEPVALRSFERLADAAVVARFLAGAGLSDDLQERAVKLLDTLEGGEHCDDE